MVVEVIVMRSTQTVIGVRQGLLLMLPGLLPVPAGALLPRCEGLCVLTSECVPIDALIFVALVCYFRVKIQCV